MTDATPPTSTSVVMDVSAHDSALDSSPSMFKRDTFTQAKGLVTAIDAAYPSKADRQDATSIVLGTAIAQRDALAYAHRPSKMRVCVSLLFMAAVCVQTVATVRDYVTLSRGSWLGDDDTVDPLFTGQPGNGRVPIN